MRVQARMLIDLASERVRVARASISVASVCLRVRTSAKYQLPLGLDTLCLKFCLLFYSLMLAGHAYYSFQVHPLFSIMPTKKNSQTSHFLLYCFPENPVSYWNSTVFTKIKISFSIVFSIVLQHNNIHSSTKKSQTSHLPTLALGTRLRMYFSLVPKL